MTKKSREQLQQLRNQAEAKISSFEVSQEETDDIKSVLHELHVHQIELEMQNEQLRQVQSELETSRDRYVDLYEFAPVGYLSINSYELIESVNLKATTMLGIERKKLLKAPFNHFVTEQDRDYWYRQFIHIKSLAPKEEFSLDLRLKGRNGKLMYANLSCLRMDETVSDSSIRITLIDITERKQIEKDMRIAATAFQTQEGIMITDANRKIIRVNKAFTEMTGYSPEEAIGQSSKLLRSDKQDQAFYNKMWDSINDSGAWEGEIWNCRKNGQAYPEHLSIATVKDESGKVINYVGTMTDITHNKAASDEIKSLAFFDPLTELPNRRLLLERLPQAIALSERSGHHGALLFLDIDNFKTLNDTLGHDLGDMLLQQVAQRLTDSLRENDTAARMGGDEFVVLLEDLHQDAIKAATQAKATGYQILTELNSLYILDNHTYNSSVSIGITVFGKNHNSSEELLKQADIAMYQAKADGRNSIRFFDPIMQEIINKRAILESDLLGAIARQEFELYFQAQVDDQGQVFGAEALIRWNHPKKGQIPPFEFIPAAEECGLILPIGEWVIESACAQLHKWQQQPQTQNLSISINVSAKQFNQPNFVDEIKCAVEKHAINGSLLNIELTESVLLNDIEETVITMNALQKIGIHFELDDFGTGYSSLQYLKKLPLHQLKIDQSFVYDITTNSSDRAIVSTIIAMAKTLNLEVIAEGVETEEHRQLLLKEGCKNYQGYLFSKPLPISEFEAFLNKSH